MAKTDFEKKFKLPEGFEKDFESRVKIKEAISKFFKSKNLKVPNLEKRGIDPRTGKREKGYYSQLVTSDYRPTSVTPGHRLYGGLDIAAGILGPHQDDFVDFMLKEGFRVIDERKAVSRSKHFRRGIFHIDDHPTEKGVLREEVPQKFKKGDKGTKVAIDGEFWRLHPKKGTGGYKIVKRVTPEGQEIKEPKKSFKQAFEEARAAGKKEFTWRGANYNTRKKGESPEEFERSLRPVDLRGPEMQRDQYLEDQDDDLTEEIIKIKEEARKPKQEIDAKDIELEQTIPMDQSVPFGVFAQGQPEFEMAEEQEKEKLMMAAYGGEVKKYQEGGELKQNPIRKNASLEEYRERGDGKTKAFDRLSDEAKKLPFLIGGDPKEGTAIFEKFDPKKDPDYYGVGIEGGYEALTESEGRGKGKQKTRKVSKDVLKVKDPVFRVKQYRDPKTGKIVKYVAPEEDKPFEEGGAFPRRRSISVTGGRGKGEFDIPEASEFRDRERAERLSGLTPYERLEGEGISYGRDSGEFGTELYDSPRSFKNMPEKSRRGLRRMAQYGDAGDLELRSFAEAFNKASEVDKAKLAKANPELFQEAKEQYGFNKGGEVKYYEEGGEVNDVPEFLRRPPEDRQPEDFRIQDVTEMDIEEPEPKPMPEPEPDLSGPEFDRDQYLMEQKSTRELLDYGIPGEDRPLAVNRELIRRKQEAGSGFEVGKGPTLEEIAAGEEEEARREEAKQRKEASRQKRERDKANKTVVEDKSQKELDEAELRKAIDDSIVQAEKTAQSIDPKRFFKKMSTFDKIVGLIGLAAGAYESYKYGGPNFYEKEIEKEVEKDIKLQKLGLEDEKRKLGVANFKVAQIAKKLAMSTKNEEQRIRLLQTVQKFQQAGAKEAAAAQKQKGLMNVNFILNTRGITDAEMAKFDSMYSGLKIRANSIKGRDGLNYFVRGGPSNMAKVKAYLADAQDSIDGLTDLYSYFDKISIVDQAVPIFSIDAAEAQSLRDRLVGKLRIEFFGPGVMTDSERAQAKKILGDPNALMTTDSREKPKILKLIMKLNYGVRDKLRRDGVAIQKTPNDLRIEQMLNRRKLQDNAKNRRFVIDALIQGEIDAQKAGKAPGSLWNMNEPLPV